MVAFNDVEVLKDPPDVARRVAEWLIGQVATSEGPFRLALSGGSTPKALFALLARPENASQMDWQRLHLFWGDERFVPYDSPDSNYGEARRILLDHVPMPAENIHPYDFGDDPDASAAAYATLLQHEYGSDTLDPARPLFDVNMLGVGEDGHTASLIPGQPVLQERDRWAAAVGQGRPEVRLTMTYPVLESAKVVAVLAVGPTKTDIIARLRAGTADVPIARLQPQHETIWFLDEASDGA